MPNCSRAFSARSTDSTTSPHPKPASHHHVRAAGGQRPAVHRSAQGPDHRLHRALGVQRRSIRCRTAAFRDMAAFGRNPIGNGPYKLADGPDGPAWEHNVRIDLRPNPDYHGNRTPHNKGLRFEFYANLDTAYSDLLSGNLDVLDTIPPSALPIYKRDLGGNVDQRSGRGQPESRHAASAAAFRWRGGPAAPPGPVGGHQPSADLPADFRRNTHSGTRFHRPVTARGSIRTFRAATRWISIPIGRGGYGRKPTRSRRGAASTRSPTTPTRAIGSGWMRWPTASRTCWESTRSARRSPPSPDSARRSSTAPSHTAFRAGWQGDYPSMMEFLAPLYATGAGSNDVGYSSRDFDAALAAAESAPSLQESYVAGQHRAANPVARHACCSALGLHQCGRLVVGGEQGDGHLEWHCPTTRTSSRAELG